MRRKILREDRKLIVALCPYVNEKFSSCDECWIRNRAKTYRKWRICKGETAKTQWTMMRTRRTHQTERKKKAQTSLCDPLFAALFGFLVGLGVKMVLDILFSPKRKRKVRVWWER